jgi:hypothetical protein
MNKYLGTFKKIAFVCTIIILLIAIAISSLGYYLGKKSSKDILSLKTIVNTFERKGLMLKKDNYKPLSTLELGGVKPSTYTLGKSKDKLLIYVFQSFPQRENAVNKSGNTDSYSLERISFNAKNTYVVYMPYQIQKDEAELKNVSKVKDLISAIVFKYLNDGKELVFKGESDSWEGTVTLKYYEHWWKDEKGVLEYENYNYETPIIKYRLTNTSALGPIAVELKTIVSSRTSTGLILKADNTLNMGEFGGNGAKPNAKDVYQVKLSYNGKEEKLVLKVKGVNNAE